MEASKKGTWGQAIFAIALPILLVFTLRWLLIEPYVIPSGSMIPNLLVHDHILVNKLSYGLRLPFTDYWLVEWSHPKRGDVIVFKYPMDPDIFYVKRIIGTPGDKLELKKGHLYINDKALPTSQKQTPEALKNLVRDLELEDFDYFKEEDRWVRYSSGHSPDSDFGPVNIPESKYFVMGDNRDQSADSRVWGLLPRELILGRAARIWLSCESTLPSASFVCDPTTIRWARIFKGVNE